MVFVLLPAMAYSDTTYLEAKRQVVQMKRDQIFRLPAPTSSHPHAKVLIHGGGRADLEVAVRNESGSDFNTTVFNGKDFKRVAILKDDGLNETSVSRVLDNFGENVFMKVTGEGFDSYLLSTSEDPFSTLVKREVINATSTTPTVPTNPHPSHDPNETVAEKKRITTLRKKVRDIELHLTMNRDYSVAYPLLAEVSVDVGDPPPIYVIRLAVQTALDFGVNGTTYRLLRIIRERGGIMKIQISPYHTTELEGYHVAVGVQEFILSRRAMLFPDPSAGQVTYRYFNTNPINSNPDGNTIVKIGVYTPSEVRYVSTPRTFKLTTHFAFYTFKDHERALSHDDLLRDDWGTLFRVRTDRSPIKKTKEILIQCPGTNYVEFCLNDVRWPDLTPPDVAGFLGNSTTSFYMDWSTLLDVEFNHLRLLQRSGFLSPDSEIAYSDDISRGQNYILHTCQPALLTNNKDIIVQLSFNCNGYNTPLLDIGQ